MYFSNVIGNKRWKGYRRIGHKIANLYMEDSNMAVKPPNQMAYSLTFYLLLLT